MSNLLIFRVLAAFSLVVAFVFFWVWLLYNSLIKLRNRVETDLSDINIQIKRKADLIERLIRLVKEYSKHEKETFENVASARSSLDTSKKVADSTKADNILTDTLRSLFAVVENYPKLQANTNYQEVSSDLKETKDTIAAYREEYNKSVQKYNNTVEIFPNMLLSSFLGFKKAELFKISKTSEN